jgi:hypothetical protein
MEEHIWDKRRYYPSDALPILDEAVKRATEINIGVESAQSEIRFDGEGIGAVSSNQ